MTKCTTNEHICPRCMSWLENHRDEKLKRDGWKRCISCAYTVRFEKLSQKEKSNQLDKLK